MAAVIDYPPYVVLTVGLRNGYVPPIFVGDLEVVAQVRGNGVAADILALVRGEGSRYIGTSLRQRCLGVIMVPPMLAGVETSSGRRRCKQSGRGRSSKEGGKMHFEGAE